MKLHAIYGPTASGKSALAFEIAAKHRMPVISADSRQVFKGMNIVTGKDLPQGDVTLLGIDLVSPNEDFSISHYFTWARQTIKRLESVCQEIVVVGGSWQYLSCLWQPPETLFSSSKLVRSQVENLPLEALQEKLASLNPEKFSSLNRSDANNPTRLKRIIEIIYSAKVPIQPIIDRSKVALTIIRPNREEVEKNIFRRVMHRVASGAVEETKNLMSLYDHRKYSSFKATGYQELGTYLEGKITLENAVQKWYLREIEYARKQFVWIKKIVRDNL